MDEATLELGALAALNVAVYASAVILMVRSPGYKVRSARDISEAFGILGSSAALGLPGVTTGATWRETVDVAQKFSLAVDWEKVEAALAAYEGLRYGGKDASGAQYLEVLKLAAEIRKGVR